MILDHLGLNGMFAFTEPVSIDLTQVGPGLVAITGDNGAGKTAIAEIVPAVTYGKCPGRENDPPIDYATTRASFMEYTFRNDAGERTRGLLSMDAQQRASEAVWQRLVADGPAQLLTDGKVTTFRKFLPELGFNSYDLYINSAFAPQGRGDEFARTKPSARKDLFAEFLGLAKLLRQAKAASDAAALCERTINRLAAAAQVLSNQTSEEASRSLDDRARQHTAEIETLSERRADWLETVADLEARLSTMADAVAAHGAATLRIQTLRADHNARAKEKVAIQDEANAAGLALIREHTRVNLVRDVAITQLDERAAGLANAPAAVTRQLAEIDTMLANNRGLQDDEQAVRAAAAAVAEADAEIARLRVTLDEHISMAASCRHQIAVWEQKLAALVVVENERARAERDAALLVDVPCGGAAPYDGCQFLKNAIAGKSKLEQLVKQLEPKAAIAESIGRVTRECSDYDATVTSTRARIKAQEQTRAQHATKAGLLAKLEAAASRIAELTTTRNSVEAASVADREQRRREIEAERERVIATHTTEAKAIEDRHAQAATDRAARMAAVVERLDVIERDLAAAEADLAGVAAGNAAAGELQTALDRARQEADMTLQALTRHQAGLQQVDRDQAAFVAKREELAVIERRLNVVKTKGLLEWRGFAKDLGKGGLADLEIDAAGPEITSLGNALLVAADLAKFSLQIITQSEKADGGMKDDFDVLIMDNTDGRGWRPMRTFSGGQRTLIQEALMIAIALYVNARAAMPMRTLFRDETGAALDRENARRYVEMLRKARELGEFHHVFFISHNDDCKEMADAQIQVANGGARLVLAPFSMAA